MHELDAESPPLRRREVGILVRDRSCRFRRNTPIDARQPQQSLREAVLDNLQATFTVDIDQNIDMCVEDGTEHLPNRQKIEDPVLQGLYLAVSAARTA